MAEIYNMVEGELKWHVASGSAGTPGWVTAADPTASGSFGFVRSMTITSAQQITQIAERGIPNHHKRTSRDAITVDVTFGWTGGYVVPTAENGSTMPLLNLEYVALNSANGSAFYQVYQVAQQSLQWTENDQESTVQMSFIGLGMSGVNSTGYLT